MKKNGDSIIIAATAEASGKQSGFFVVASAPRAEAGGKQSSGFTLLEVIIALMIFSIAITALMGLAGTAIKSTDMGRRRTQAINIATEKIEALKKISFSDIQAGSSTSIAGIGTRNCAQAGNVFTCTPTAAPLTLDGMPFMWLWKVTYVDLDNDGVFFSTGTIIDSNDIKKIDVIVSWTDLFGPHEATLATLRAI
jgi:prepilin-type N-terminal cleavage/methylation domain-containing protein